MAMNPGHSFHSTYPVSPQAHPLTQALWGSPLYNWGYRVPVTCSKAHSQEAVGWGCPPKFAWKTDRTDLPHGSPLGTWKLGLSTCILFLKVTEGLTELSHCVKPPISNHVFNDSGWWESCQVLRDSDTRGWPIGRTLWYGMLRLDKANNWVRFTKHSDTLQDTAAGLLAFTWSFHLLIKK
jgi:hypothetical protein